MLKQILNNFLQQIFPSQCISCGVFVTFSEGLCHNCWNDIKFIDNNSCAVCSTPFDHEIEKNSGIICAKCIADRPLYNKHRSVMEYDDIASRLISNFKYKDHTYLHKYFSKLIFNHFKEIIEDGDIIIPVPLHNKKLRNRKYNQSALIAKLLSEISGKKTLYDGLLKIKNTPSQVGLDYQQRVNNLKNSIIINKKQSRHIKNKKIILIDDVMTTGTTINICCKELLKAEPANIDVITLAMSVKG